MQRLEQIRSGKAARNESPVVAKKAPANTRGVGGENVLGGTIVPRQVSRTSNQRHQSRHPGIADIVRVNWREEETEARVLNISECGLMIEAAITPGIGDRIEIRFDGCDPLDAAVIWRKGDRLGLDFGQPVIDLFPVD